MLIVESSRLAVPMKQVSLDQGSPEWLRWRETGIGASEAAAIMGVSPWDTAYSLWEVKTGRKPPKPMNPAMQRGKEMEEVARQAYEAETGELVTPMCAEHGAYSWMKSSLDGITFSGDITLEIKCPGQKDHALALNGIVPPKYFPQVQHQMMVAGAQVKFAHYWSYDGENGKLIVVPRDNEYIWLLAQAEAKFWDCVRNNTPPIDDEVRLRSEAWRLTKQRLEQAKADEDEIRSLLLTAAGIDTSVVAKHDIGLLTVSVSEVKGKIDYEKLFAAHGIKLTDEELDKYRGEKSVQVKLLANKVRKQEMAEELIREQATPKVETGDEFVLW